MCHIRLNFSLLIIIFSFLILQTSCEKDFKFSGDFPSNKPSIYCFLNDSDTITKVFVKTPISFGIDANYDSSNVSNAIVNISDGTNSFNLQYSPIYKYYSVSNNILSIKKGSSYFLTILTKDGNQLSGSCTIPKSLCPAYQFQSSRDSLNFRSFEYSYTFNDSSNQINYYLLQTYYPLVNNNDTNFYNIFQSIPIKKDRNQYNINYSKHVTLSISEYSHIAYYGHSISGSGLTSSLFLIDENIYKFYITKNENLKSQQLLNPSPAPVFSNIENGYGIMGSLFLK